MSITNYQKSCAKWNELLKKIFGTVNVTCRIEPSIGKIFFSTNGIEQIKANIVFLAMTKSNSKITKWCWAWGGNKRLLGLIPDDNRIVKEDIDTYIKEGGEFENSELFTKGAITLNNTESGRRDQLYIRAKMLEIFEGQFLYEADLNGNNALFIILNAKKIKQAEQEKLGKQEKVDDAQSEESPKEDVPKKEPPSKKDTPSKKSSKEDESEES